MTRYRSTSNRQGRSSGVIATGALDERASGPQQAMGIPEAKEACLGLLAMRARSHGELRERLARKGFEPDVIDAALSRLAEVGLVDDGAFAREWALSRHRHSGRGTQALARELRARGIADEHVEQALAGIAPEDERARAVEFVARRLARSSMADPDGHLNRDDERRLQQRLTASLIRRGYPSSMAVDVVRAELERCRERN